MKDLVKVGFLGGILLAFSTTLLIAKDDFASFIEEHNTEAELFNGMEQAEFDEYQLELEAGFKAFEQAYQEENRKFKKEITQQWGEFKDSDNKNWVSYADGGKVRRSVNYEKGTIEVDVLADKSVPESELLNRVKKQVERLLTTTEMDAFKLDKVSQKVEQKMQRMSAVLQQGKPSSKRRVLAPLIPQLDSKSTAQVYDAVNRLLMKSTSEVRKSSKAGKKVMRISLTIPPNLSNKVGQYEKQVRKIASTEEIHPALIYAVMETESYFNPRAKSHIPAYGLMQIVPVSAGKDATAYLFGKAKVLAPSYLYDSNKNIEVGGAYLHILYYRYLKSIKDPQSRLYCVIAGYNTGAGNVARSFTGSNNVKKASKIINKMSPDEVYKYLRKNLKHAETQRYLKKVTTKMQKYL